MTELVDSRGRPLRREVLTQEIAGPTLAGLRSPIAGYPADGLNPVRLATILRGADAGEPQRYFELAELIEERDPHYAGVLGVRKRAVSQIAPAIVAASDEPADKAMADTVRDWLDRDELADELFDILDAVGKGDSFTEIVWDTSEGQWRPGRLEWRDPRWFQYDRADGRTPLLRGGESGHGTPAELEPFKFIRHTVKAKSGLPVRSGLARIAAWGWMFKAFTQRDWAIFTQTFGQPVRVGKFNAAASEADKATLFRAVANIAGDMAAIIPASMQIEFIESANVGAGSDLYERRSDWLDRQTSKAVLGQTGTTDSKAGGLGDGGNKVHNDVRDDIKTADGRALAATLNRDLIRPWIDLEFGPQKRYPRLRIEQPKIEDIAGLSTALGILVPAGLKVSAIEVRDRMGLREPAPDEEVLVPPTGASPPAVLPPVIVPPATSSPPALQSTAPVARPADVIADRLVGAGVSPVQGWLEKLATMMESATSLSELKAMVLAASPDLDAGPLAAALGDGFLAAQAAGLSDAADQSGG